MPHRKNRFVLLRDNILLKGSTDLLLIGGVDPVFLRVGAKAIRGVAGLRLQGTRCEVVREIIALLSFDGGRDRLTDSSTALRRDQSALSVIWLLVHFEIL